AITPATPTGLGRNRRPATTNSIAAATSAAMRCMAASGTLIANRSLSPGPSAWRDWFRCGHARGHDERADQPARDRSTKRRELLTPLPGDGAVDYAWDFVLRALSGHALATIR